MDKTSNAQNERKTQDKIVSPNSTTLKYPTDPISIHVYTATAYAWCYQQHVYNFSIINIHVFTATAYF